jgi:hypothetical protein
MTDQNHSTATPIVDDATARRKQDDERIYRNKKEHILFLLGRFLVLIFCLSAGIATAGAFIGLGLLAASSPFFLPIMLGLFIAGFLANLRITRNIVPITLIAIFAKGSLFQGLMRDKNGAKLPLKRRALMYASLIFCMGSGATVAGYTYLGTLLFVPKLLTLMFAGAAIAGGPLAAMAFGFGFSAFVIVTAVYFFIYSQMAQIEHPITELKAFFKKHFCDANGKVTARGGVTIGLLCLFLPLAVGAIVFAAISGNSGLFHMMMQVPLAVHKTVQVIADLFTGINLIGETGFFIKSAVVCSLGASMLIFNHSKKQMQAGEKESLGHQLFRYAYNAGLFAVVTINAIGVGLIAAIGGKQLSGSTAFAAGSAGCGSAGSIFNVLQDGVTFDDEEMDDLGGDDDPAPDAGESAAAGDGDSKVDDPASFRALTESGGAGLHSPAPSGDDSGLPVDAPEPEAKHTPA